MKRHLLALVLALAVATDSQARLYSGSVQEIEASKGYSIKSDIVIPVSCLNLMLVPVTKWVIRKYKDEAGTNAELLQAFNETIRCIGAHKKTQ